jgi:hypothetical protein
MSIKKAREPKNSFETWTPLRFLEYSYWYCYVRESRIQLTFIYNMVTPYVPDTDTININRLNQNRKSKHTRDKSQFTMET